VRAVEGRDRQQVEEREQQVEPDPVRQHLLQDRERRRRVRQRAPEQPEHDDEQRTDERQHEVGAHAGQRDDDVASLVVPEVARVHRHGLGAAEDQPAAQRR
jgi:hypothetical protein